MAELDPRGIFDGMTDEKAAEYKKRYPKTFERLSGHLPDKAIAASIASLEAQSMDDLASIILADCIKKAHVLSLVSKLIGGILSGGDDGGGDDGGRKGNEA